MAPSGLTNVGAGSCQWACHRRRRCPFMPPMAPPGTSPAGVSPPTDYTQQLFSYLQAWREYLEQAIGAVPGTTTQQPTGPPPPTTPPAGPRRRARSAARLHGLAVLGLDVAAMKASSCRCRARPKTITGPSRRRLQEQIQRDARHRTRKPFRQRRSWVRFGIRREGGFRRLRPIDTTRTAIALSGGGRAADTPSVTGMDTPSVTGMQPGRDPRRAAPPATSKWWEVRRGLRPAFQDNLDAMDFDKLGERRLLDIKALGLGERGTRRSGKRSRQSE